MATAQAEVLRESVGTFVTRSFGNREVLLPAEWEKSDLQTIQENIERRMAAVDGAVRKLTYGQARDYLLKKFLHLNNVLGVFDSKKVGITEASIWNSLAYIHAELGGYMEPSLKLAEPVKVVELGLEMKEGNVEGQLSDTQTVEVLTEHAVNVLVADGVVSDMEQLGVDSDIVEPVLEDAEKAGEVVEAAKNLITDMSKEELVERVGTNVAPTEFDKGSRSTVNRIIAKIKEV